MMSYAGLDVAKQATHVCVVDEGGQGGVSRRVGISDTIRS